MLPTPNDVHLNAATGSFSIRNMGQRFIADLLFPVVPVGKMSDYYYKFPKGAWFRNEAGLRGPGGASRRGGYTLSPDTYSCKERSYEHPVPKETIANADDPLRPEQTGIAFAKNGVWLRKEADMASLLTTAGNWTTSDDVAGDWAYTDTSNTFIADTITGSRTVQELIGIPPNVFWCDGVTWDHIRQNEDVLDRIKYSGGPTDPAKITASMIAALIEVDLVLVGTALKSTAEEVVAGTDFTASRLWETNANKGSAGLLYVPPAAGLEIPSAGYQIRWEGLSSENEQSEIIEVGDGWLITRYWEKPTKSWIYGAAQSYDLKVTGADAGYLFYDTYAG